jgi:hypothetical protein
MKEWEVVAESVVMGAVGVEANKMIVLPFSSGNSLIDGLIDLGIGLAIAYAGTKVDHDELGIGVSALGAGYAVSAGANMLGYRL